MVALADRTARWVWPLTWPLSSLPPCSNTAHERGSWSTVCFMFITGPLQTATFVTCLGYWERELNGLTRRRPGGGPRGPGSGPPSSGLLCFMFIRPGTLYTCLRRQGNEAESDVAAPGGFRSRVNEPAFYTDSRTNELRRVTTNVENALTERDVLWSPVQCALKNAYRPNPREPRSTAAIRAAGSVARTTRTCPASTRRPGTHTTLQTCSTIQRPQRQSPLSRLRPCRWPIQTSIQTHTICLHSTSVGVASELLPPSSTRYGPSP